MGDERCKKNRRKVQEEDKDRSFNSFYISFRLPESRILTRSPTYGFCPLSLRSLCFYASGGGFLESCGEVRRAMGRLLSREGFWWGLFEGEDQREGRGGGEIASPTPYTSFQSSGTKILSRSSGKFYPLSLGSLCFYTFAGGFFLGAVKSDGEVVSGMDFGGV